MIYGRFSGCNPRAKIISQGPTQSEQPASETADQRDIEKSTTENDKSQANPLAKIATYSAATLGKTMTLGKYRTGTSKTKEILKQYVSL